MSPVEPTALRPHITLLAARRAIATAHEEAARNGWVISVAVVDMDGEPIALEKQDAAIGISPYLALAKARDAVRSQIPLQQLPWSDDFRASVLSLTEGAVAVVANGQVIGAVGVNGTDGTNGSTVARVAAIAALEQHPK